MKDLLGMGRSGVVASLIAASQRLQAHEHRVQTSFKYLPYILHCAVGASSCNNLVLSMMMSTMYLSIYIHFDYPSPSKLIFTYLF